MHFYVTFGNIFLFELSFQVIFTYLYWVTYVLVHFFMIYRHSIHVWMSGLSYAHVPPPPWFIKNEASLEECTFQESLTLDWNQGLEVNIKSFLCGRTEVVNSWAWSCAFMTSICLFPVLRRNTKLITFSGNWSRRCILFYSYYPFGEPFSSCIWPT